MSEAVSSRAVVAAIALAACIVAAPLDAQQTAAIAWEPYPAQIGGEKVEGAQLGRLRVPERHDAPDGRTLELAFVRLPGRAVGGGTPTIYLDGGPGGSGVSVIGIPSWAPLLDGLREVGDVILLSQRGAGLSRPRLACGADGAGIPGAAFRTRDALLTAMAPAVASCVAEWQGRADLSAYNTRESADDVDDVRRALGAERMNILGFSYGTHLGLAVLRRHGGSVAHAVLAGVEGPDETFKLPSALDDQLRRLSYAIARDSSTADDFPDLYGSLRDLLAELDARPRVIDVGEDDAVTFGGDALRYLLRLDLGDTNDLPYLPALIQDVRSERAPILTALLARRVRAVRRGVPLMSLAMDCASSAPAARLERIRAERGATLLGAMTETIYPDVCAMVPVEPLDSAFRAPVRSSVPTLFVSGMLDSNTPPYQAERIRWGFPNGVHLVVENAGHESTLSVPEVQSAVVRFLKGGAVRDAFVEQPPLDFLDRDEALARLAR